ncbi:MAG: 1-acyl-sn-glycerol-3-phosphate acyltransferase [Clostridia bacterium]|nr:1-acyl-sn-glycerol-3-phosphate acyltransferase [Clostridia bacterium]
MLYTVMRFIGLFIRCCLMRLVMVGRENLTAGNTLFVCNHLSSLDAAIQFSVLPRHTHFMAKKELFRNRLNGWFLRRAHTFPIDRQSVDLKAIKEATGLLSAGKDLCIFPQGTRCKNVLISAEQMHSGIGMIALRAHSRIIPMMFTARPRLFHKNTLMIGEPLDLSAFAAEKINSQTIHAFSEAVRAGMNRLIEKP